MLVKKFRAYWSDKKKIEFKHTKKLKIHLKTIKHSKLIDFFFLIYEYFNIFKYMIENNIFIEYYHL